MASADLVNEGESGTSQWRSVSMENGEVMTAYSGGCLWAAEVENSSFLVLISALRAFQM
jgi:hypothetical protein